MAKTIISIETVRGRLTKKLQGFTKDFPDNLDSWSMSSHRPDPKEFPVPEMLLFMLRNLMGWRWQGVGEKKRWSVYGSIAGEPIVFELRKFGFTILRNADAQIPMDRIIGQLQTALSEVEKLLMPYAEAQIDRGEVLIVNRANEFSNRYQFFRNLADKAYAKASKGPRSKRGKGAKSSGDIGNPSAIMSDIFEEINYSRRAESEGFFHSAAMVDAYFSSLEHRLVLLRAFLGTQLAPNELKGLLAAKWNDKLKAAVPADSLRSAELLLASMRRIKERIRNPFAHGGVENDGGSLFFQLPNVGMLPANLSKFGDSIRFSFLPIAAADHAECCAAFDQLDALLSTGAMTGPHLLLAAGVDPVFDEKSLKRYAEAIAEGEEGIERFIERWGHEWMQHANMDY